MNLDELQSVRDRERQTDKLQQLRASFYADAGTFIQQLREERERAAERADDPFDAPEVNQLTDEINTAEQTVEAIYEKRVGKIVKAASFAAADLPSESEGMTQEEEQLFETLVSDIRTNREHVLDVLAGDAAPTSAARGAAQSDSETATTDTESAPEAHTDPVSREIPPEPTDEGSPAADSTPAETQPDQPTEQSVSAADLMGEQSEEPPTEPEPVEATGGEATASVSSTPSEEESGATEESDPPIRNDGGQAAETSLRRERVRITEDIDTFVGFDDREYDLGENDVVTLPATNVPPLLERGVAKQLD